MKVSVVIPVYNEEKYIKTCLNHVTNQEEPADEILVVDNNSTDKTVEIVKQFPVTLLHEPIQGMTPARNKGFNVAKGDILVKTDSDTRVPKNWIKKIKKNFEEKDISALSGPTTFYDAAFKAKDFSELLFNAIKTIYHHSVIFGPNYSITKTVWNEIKNKICLDDSKVHEDFDISLHIPDPSKIYFDTSLVVPISARRIKQHPESFFGTYLLRTIRMMKDHGKKLF